LACKPFPEAHHDTTNSKHSLAILGEASILANAQVSTNSPFFLLPRLLPAPQALIRTSRPERLVPSTGKVLGARSGGIKDDVNHIAHLLHDGDHLPAYSVRCERITKNPNRPSVRATLFGPLTWLSLLGCAMSIAILVLAIVKKDGMALLAVLLLSILSTIIGIGSRWSLELKKRKSTREVPVSDVVISYPQGAFMIVKCDEDVARELYWHPERCIYHVGPTAYRLISLTATLLLMFAVIFLSNAQLPLQLCFAAAYIILNAAYWTAAALPQRWNWDLSRFRVKRVRFAGGELNDAFTHALWKAIAVTKSVEWVHNGSIAPRSQAWKEWLEKADEMAHGPSMLSIGMDSKPSTRSPEVTITPEDEEKDEVIVLPEWDCDAALTGFLNPDSAAKNV